MHQRDVLPSPATARMRPILAPVLALILLAPSLAGAQLSRFRFSVPGYTSPVIFDSVATTVDIAAPRGATFGAVSAVLQELKIPTDNRDSLQGLIGNSRIAKMRNFAGTPMSRLLNCGSGMTGLHADAWRIYISLFVLVEPRGSDASTLRIAFIAGAQDVEGVSKDAVMCASTGALESMLTERVRKRLLATPAS